MSEKYILNIGLARALLAAIQEYNIPLVEGVIPEDAVSEYPDVNRLYYSGTAILSQDLSGTLNFYNLAAAHIFGYDIEEALGMPSVKLVPVHLRMERSNEFQKILEEKVKLELDTVRLNKHGEIISIHAHVFPYELGTDIFSIAATIELKEQL